MRRLLGYQTLSGIIRCETGLKIGGTRDTLEIGGVDNPVIKHPITGMPYIPGSSLKGKLRSLLELKYGKFDQERGAPYQGRLPDGKEDLSCPISRIFGPHRNPVHNFGPTRIIVRDAHLTPEWLEIFKRRREELGDYFLESKSENVVNRKTGVADTGGLRTMERIPAGTEFYFEIVLRNFDWNQEKMGDESKENLKTVTEALSMLKSDYLGGSGSRGYGKISFREVKLDGEHYDIP